MGMRDIESRGEEYTWLNNGEGKGFIQERLDRFFGSAKWMLYHDNAIVRHILRQESDHSLILLDSSPMKNRTKARFIFKARWTMK